MADVNGTGGALAPPKRLRFSVVPQSTTIEIERPNAFRASDDDPETMVVELTAWPQGERCPAWIGIQAEAAWDAYRAGMTEELARRAAAGELVADPETGVQAYTGPTHIMSQIMATLRRDLLCAVIEGLSEHEASTLVRNGGPWEEILVSLGWWARAATTQVEPEGGDADPEAEAGAVATDASSPA